MKTFDVTIKCTIIKTIRVEAKDEDEAEEIANSEFTLDISNDEHYSQNTLDIEWIEENNE